MRALQLVDWKHEPEFREVDEPEPGPGQVVIEVAGAGACHSDLHLMHDFDAGLLPYPLPFTLGHENAGHVRAVGPGVAWLEEGQPVAVYGPWGCGHCPRCLEGMENYCDRAAEIGVNGGGLGVDGGMAPLMLVPSARYCLPLGDLDPVEAAPLTDAGLTPYHAIRRSRHLLTPGSVAVVIGAGGLGHMAVQILKATSAATVVAVDTNEDALRLAVEVGADHALVSGPTTADDVRTLSRGRGADLVLDLVGVDATMQAAVAMGRSLGAVTVVGIGGGSYPFGFFTLAYEVSLATTYWGSLPELAELLALAEAGHVKAHVQRFSLDEAPEAYRLMKEGGLRGRAVIVP